jgi:hypothetical protein
VRRSNRLVGVLSVLLAVCGVLCVGTTAKAAILNLASGNSTASIDDSGTAGQYSWVVDGVSHLYQQGFWVRVGNAGGETALGQLTLAGSGVLGGLAYLNYTGLGLDITVQYTLAGGLPNTNTSDIAETITINNVSGSALDVHFFQYVDFDLNGPLFTTDWVEFVNANAVDQWGAGVVVSETVVTPAASHYEGGFFANTLNSLTDGNPTTLSDTPGIGVALGPGDMTWAYQWDVNLADRDTFIISKDKHLSAAPVPEPATIIVWSLLGSLAIAFGWRRCK